MRKLFSAKPLLLLFVSILALTKTHAQTRHLVISQLYSGAGCGSANCSSYKNDFIEIFNPTGTTQNLNGWSVQYAAAAGSSWQVTPLTNVTLQPGQYYLIAEETNANGAASIPTADKTDVIAMATTTGKVALVNTTVALSGACPAGAQIIDMVGYGSLANCFEGAAIADLSNTTSAIRKFAGCTDGGNNANDFSVTTPNPRNTASPFNLCVTANLADQPAGSLTTAAYGETITYKNTITNNGTSDATGVTVTTTLPANVTFNGNEKSSALANSDSYTTGYSTNATPVTLNVTTTAAGVKGNDFGLPVSTFKVSFFGPTASATTPAGTPGTTNGNGSLKVNDDGTFDYTPLSGFTGVDQFKYKVTTNNGVAYPDDEATVSITVGAAPVATADAYTAIGNVFITRNVLSNDNIATSGATVTAVNGSAGNVGTKFNTPSGATVTLAADGSLTYSPPPGFEGADVFNYTINNGFNSPSTVNVTVTMTGMIWFIDNNSTASDADGRLSSPFKTLAAFNTANTGGAGKPDVNDNIFLYESATPYTGSVVLLTGQRFIGQDASQELGQIIPAFASLPPGSGALPVMKTALPATTVSNADAIKLATAGGNLVQGLTVTATSGSALFLNGVASGNNTATDLIMTTSGSAAGVNLSTTSYSGTFTYNSGSITSSGTGTAFNITGSATVSCNVDITQTGNGSLVAITNHPTGTITFQTGKTLLANNGNGLQFNNADGVYNFNGTNTLNGGDAGIDIITNCAGTFTFSSNTTITDPSGSAFNIDQSTASVTYNGTITQNNAGRVINISNATAGTVVFAGAVTGTGTNTGVILSNTNITINFTGSVNLNGTSTLFTATGGTLAVTGSTNNIGNITPATPSSLAALTLSNLVVGAGGINFQNVSANVSGTAYGVNLNGLSGAATTINGGTINGSAGNAAFNIASSSSNITYAGAINQSNGQRVINVTSASGGTIVFSGAVTGTGTNTGINLTTNTGAVIRFTGGVNLNGTASGFLATGGGTISVTGGGNNIGNSTAAITATPLSLANVTIGGEGFTFQNVSSGGAANGISLSAVTGTITINGGTLTGGAGTAFTVTNGNPAVTYAGIIAQNTATQYAVSIDGTTGNTISFTGTVGAATGVAGVAARGVNITNVNGGSVSFSNLNLGTAGNPMTGGTALSILKGAATSGIGNFTLGNVNIYTTNQTGLIATDINGTISSTTGVINTSGGTAITIDGPAGFTTLAMTLTSVTSSGGTNNISLLDCIGSATLGSGALSAATGASFIATRGSATVSYGGNITSVNGQRAVDIQNQTSGANYTLSGTVTVPGTSTGINVANNTATNVTFSGSISATTTNVTAITVNNNSTSGIIEFSGASKSISTGTATAVNLTTNTGVTINFSNGGLAITTSSGTGFNATGGGTISVTKDLGSGNTINSSTGTGMNVTSTTIAATGLNFQSISSGGGANLGINLVSTGAGGLTVSGTGTASSGGTITGKTGADGSTTSGTGIYLSDASNVTLKWMTITNHQNYGIRGNEVDGFRLENSLVGGVNGNNVATPYNEGSISFIGTPTTGYGLKGSVAILDNEITGGYQRNVSIDNATGTMNINFLRNNVHHTNGSFGDDGLAIEVDNSAVMFANISNNIFTAHGGDHFNLSLLNNANADLTFKNNDMQGGHAIGLGQGVFILGATYNGIFKYDISNNGTAADPFIGNRQGAAIFVNKGSGTATYSGQITNNYIGNAAVNHSGSLEAQGIHASARGAGGSHKTLIQNNTVRQYHDRGIVLEAGEGSPSFTATVLNNTVADWADAVNSLYGIHCDFGILTADNAQVTIDVRNNLIANAGNEAQGGVDFRMRTAGSNDVLIGGCNTCTTAAAVQAYIDAQNSDGTTFSVSLVTSQGPPAATYNNGPSIPFSLPNLPTLPPAP